MDLGFARRSNAATTHANAALDLASLLSEIAARQAVTPTARASAAADMHEDALISVHPEIERFAPRADRKTIGNAVSSFSPEVASAILTSRKPF
jgi:hypothetical protein